MTLRYDANSKRGFTIRTSPRLSPSTPSTTTFVLTENPFDDDAAPERQAPDAPAAHEHDDGFA